MHRVWFVLIGLLFLSGGLVRAQEDASLQQALALQKVMQKVIREAEPSIACILVSRSEGYKRVGQGPPAPEQGRLGAFNGAFLGQSEEEALLRKKLNMAEPGYVPESFGSGVVVDPSGLILTHYHVVRDAAKIFVRLPGAQASYADIHAADPRSDLAVLRMLSNNLNLPVIKLGDGDKLERGQFILSIANPYAAGFRDGRPSASWGIISNLRRRAPSGHTREDERAKTLHQYGTLIQTDARLTLGCSGGALLNLQGEMVGLTTSVAALHGGETPGGYAVPMDAGMKRIVKVLKRGEEVDYGFLGITLNDDKAYNGPGVSLSSVCLGSPAEFQARLRPQDVILKVDGAVINDNDDLFLALGKHLAGEKVKLEVRRYGQKVMPVEVTLVKHNLPGKPIASSLGSRPRVRGLRVDYTSLMASQIIGRGGRWGRIPQGVLITDVEPSSPAAAAQLRAQTDIITHVNGQAVTDPASFYREFAKHRGPIELTLYASNPAQPPPKVTIH